MALNGPTHSSGLDVTFLSPLTISTAVSATATPVIKGLVGTYYLVVEAVFLYGAGGTTTTAFIQTSLDNGLSWIDIMNFAFTTAAASKVSAVVATTALSAVTVPGDAALGSNLIVSGLLGSRFRAKYVTTGTYSGATSLALYGCFK